jgi:hypothetical protein
VFDVLAPSPQEGFTSGPFNQISGWTGHSNPALTNSISQNVMVLTFREADCFQACRLALCRELGTGDA